jgi:hypothetical protein
MQIDSLPVRSFLNPQYNLMKRDGYGKWNVSFTITLLFPTK